MLAFGMMQVVQGKVAFDLTGRNGSVGFVYLGQGFAMLFLSPVGGALSDRVSKKKMLSLAQFVIGVMFGVIAVLIATDLITIYLLAGGALVLGIMFSMMGPTRQAWVGDLLYVTSSHGPKNVFAADARTGEVGGGEEEPWV